MGIDIQYQGIPYDAEILSLASSDKDIAKDLLFPIILFGDAREGGRWLEGIHDIELIDLYTKYPNLADWNYDDGRRGIDNFISYIDPAAERALNFQEFQEYEYERTMGYQFVLGHEVFSENFSSTIGFPVRVSPPHFVKECVRFCQTFDRDRLPKGLIERFDELANYYQMIASHENVAVFIMQN